MESEYLLHAGVRAMVDFDSDIFAAGNCYDQNQYKDYWLFCPYAYRLPEGPILAKDLAVEYKYLSNSSEWFYIARKNADRVIAADKQFSKGFNTYTHNESAHSARMPDEILAVTYEDGHWSKPYYDCGGANIWMLTYTVPFFGFDHQANKYYFKGTSGIDIDLRRVDIDQCPLPLDSSELNIFAASDKCKTDTTECVPVPGLGFRRGSYMCVCRRGFYFPDILSQNRYFNGTVIEEEYEKYMMGEDSRYPQDSVFECLKCADGCDACVDASPCVLALNWAMRSAVLGLSLVPVLCLPVVVWFTCRYGHVKVVRAASPVLLRVIALGAFLIYCTTIVMYPQPNMITCSLRVWLREIGFSLTYGALMLKTWRISVIFRVRSAKAVRITDMDLLKRLGFIVGAFSALLLMRTLVAPPPVVVAKSADDLKAFLCRTDWWDHCFSLMEVVLLVWGIWLCIGVRKAPSEFNESRFISMAIYNEFLLSIFLNISMLFLQSPANPDLLYVIFFSHTQLTVTMLLCFIFGSKAYMVYKGQGKIEEHGAGSYGTKPAQTAIKFLTAGSRHSPRGSPNRTMYGGATPQAYSNTPSSAALPPLELNGDPSLELDRLSSQLELLRQRHVKMGTNRRVLCKIAAIQRVIGEVEDEDDDESPLETRDGHSLNNVIAAVTDKIVCAAMSRVDSVPDTDDLDDLGTPGLDMSVESAALNRSLTRIANSSITLDDKTHFTNEISV
ncbi:probable G-protein coupled receptor CG31760 isoform X2 [Neocloeon triangulifer]|nr:probable G-protein coupled receptor CG31760 isoform X2 [Neocloeon triangulifer]